jgi:hypothetical protein
MLAIEPRQQSKKVANRVVSASRHVWPILGITDYRCESQIRTQRPSQIGPAVSRKNGCASGFQDSPRQPNSDYEFSGYRTVNSADKPQLLLEGNRATLACHRAQVRPAQLFTRLVAFEPHLGGYAKVHRAKLGPTEATRRSSAERYRALKRAKVCLCLSVGLVCSSW